MTEADWNRCFDPQAMLEFLRETGRATDRKLRLFACACCRRIWHLLKDERSRELVSASERYADGKTTFIEVADAYRRHDPAESAYEVPSAFFAVCYAAGSGTQAAVSSARDAAGAAGFAPSSGRDDDDTVGALHARYSRAERAAQAALLRDIHGPVPFREVTIERSLLNRHDGAIGKLAQAIYEEWLLPDGTLDGDRLGKLADALEQAECDNEEALSHLRLQGAVHVRGCWVIDLLLENT